MVWFRVQFGKKHARTSEFFKDDQNRTGARASAIEDLKNSRMFVFKNCTTKHILCIGNSMVSSAIWKKHATSEFFKDDQNCTSPKDEYNLKSLKNSRVYVFSNCTRNHTITC